MSKRKQALSKEETLEIIKKLKNRHFGEIALDCNFGELNYKLVLLTAECAQNHDLMELIGRWRKENEIWFSSKFKVTVERTTKWFNERLICAPDRLLFIIDVNGVYIGHMGLFRFDFDNLSCEIDNIVRGEAKYPGVIRNAITHMMKWGRNNLGLKDYSLQTRSDNERALKLYNKLGFTEIKRIPLILVEGKDGLEWVDAPEIDVRKVEKFNVIMKLANKEIA